MRPVIQLERTGCGIASVAAITGHSYPKAKAMARTLGISADDPKLRSETQHIRKLLKRCGAKPAAREAAFRSWRALPDLALLAIKWHLERGEHFWHWVVFVRDATGEYVMDSKPTLKNHRRTDFGRIKPKWYMAVTKS